MNAIDANPQEDVTTGSLHQAITTRRAVRHFTSQAVSREMVEEILALANRAPSSYNLQPWHFIAVDDPETKQELRQVAFGQAQVTEAPWVIALLVDPAAAEQNLEAVVEQSLRVGAVSPEHVAGLRKLVQLSFSPGPLGLGGLVKAALFQVIGLFRPVPAVRATRSGLRWYWLSESLLAADHLMLAARSMGLDTCPMRGFDPGRVGRILGVPRRLEVALLIPLGYGQPDGHPGKPRLPLQDKLHWNRFQAGSPKA